MTTTEAPSRNLDFIREIVEADLQSGKHTKIVTRFPPEPNGYLHIGHAKAICLDFGVALEYGGKCNLRFDDTNPEKEEAEFARAILEDVRWLGFEPAGSEPLHASDYFDQLYEWAEWLIAHGKAYVDDLTAEEIREYRGTLTEPGKESPYRDRGVDENLDLFRRMRAGEFPDGAHVLRAKIDMASGNINMRDPVMYRIRKTSHQRTGDTWVIYPMYDWAHGQSDYIEGVTYSLCSLEYEDHRPLYDWYFEALRLRLPRPRQIEFARLNLNYTVMSKRMLLELVESGRVSGWDDPRMPTIAGLRRRGYTPESIRNFCERIGVAKRNNVVDIANLEHAIREDLNLRAPRVMAVLNPLKVVIENYPDGHTDEVDVINNPEDPSAGTRKVPFGRELYIEQDDFAENPPPKYFRLFPGNEVRLRYAYWVRCTNVVKDSAGNVTEVHCTYDPATKGGHSPPDGRKVKG
ncbi:MAG TPA: glutamine--tRNA ligase/YqeY domain fusion protein, partial [Thermoanaerobaculia bacterium]|nr:glutamine--tRNA ligase/YqeY domain fusion protein [Thermoanaerobaculia bacterium]